MYSEFDVLSKKIEGDIFVDEIQKVVYSTDASAYKEKPMAVIRPKSVGDIKRIVNFVNEHKLTIIPRAAGTSLAGQVVGNGVVVDISKYMNQIIEINEKEKYAIVQPGVVRDELNIAAAKHGLFFAPETSTSNRCMIGGMLGNNSCGANSIIYGSTREHTISSKAILADGSDVEFKSITAEEYKHKTEKHTLEGHIYKSIYKLLEKPETQKEIEENFPTKDIKRRNTGYAVDLLLDNEVFDKSSEQQFNLNKLVAGSEGTLVFNYEIKVNLVDLPPKHTGLLCVHLDNVIQAARANLIALKYKPTAVEFMDDIILNLTKGNITQSKNRFFVQGDPGAMLIVELKYDNQEDLLTSAKQLEDELRQEGYGYHYPLVTGADVKKVWNLRKAGLGILANMPGDEKPVPVVEDTTVKPEDLPAYLQDVEDIFKKHNLKSVYYAHIATGELHIRPIINLKTEQGREMFKTIAAEFARLVKKYKGSLSGEHGDGRLRGEFIPMMIGEKNYQLIKEVKQIFDAKNIFNAHKIVETPSMNTFMRYDKQYNSHDVETVFDYSDTGGYQQMVEKCNGSGDCRKSHIIGGTMCPSYQASHNESQTTRARANVLREFMSRTLNGQNPLNHKEIYEIMDLCLSCKACKSECPSNVDITKLKAEFLNQYYKENGIPLRTRMIGFNPIINKFISPIAPLVNLTFKLPVIGDWIVSAIGFSNKRRVPDVHSATVTKYANKLKQGTAIKGKVYLFNDEFTNFNDPDIGIAAIQLLNKLGYQVEIPRHDISARTFLSKGMLGHAKKIATANVMMLKDIIDQHTPLIGIEPSAILGFRDEYPSIVDKNLREDAKQLSKNTLMFDEWFVKEAAKGNIKKEDFTQSKLVTKLHGHCQQKAIASTESTIEMLSFPENYSVDEIPSGCCGMAGSFGYETEHYDLSMKIGELVLFPSVRAAANTDEIAAPGTSCRHQIKDGTNRNAKHPIVIMHEALA